tara:strand:+ start:115 stop:312 length:198 start_codon:yes stop_codon:yes gene_type:complete
MKDSKKVSDEVYNIIEIIEQEMMLMWATGEIPYLLEHDPEFVDVIMDGVMLERSFWRKCMVVGEA